MTAGFPTVARRGFDGSTSWPPPKAAREPAIKNADWVPAPPMQAGLATTLALISMTILALLINLVVVSSIQHYTSQKSLYEQFRLSLAEGSAPVSPLGVDGVVLTPGTPVALMRAGQVGIGAEVIVEGTASSQTMLGIGHRRDTVLPCQVGTSVLMARSGSYGGVGSAWAKLQPGDQLTMQMGQGSCTYEVTDQRRVGDLAPPAPTGREGRLTLTTAAGLPYMPTEVLRVDAKLVSDGFDKSTTAFPPGSLPPSEAAMGVDTSNLFALVLLLEVLVGAAFGAVWLWKRWGRWQTYLIAGPVLAAVGLLAATNVNLLLPNLL